MTTLKEKIEQTYGNILTDGDIDWFMDEIAAYTKRVIGEREPEKETIKDKFLYCPSCEMKVEGNMKYYFYCYTCGSKLRVESTNHFMSNIDGFIRNKLKEEQNTRAREEGVLL